MGLQTIRKILFALMALFTLEAFAQEQLAARDCTTKQTIAQLPLDRSGDLGQQASIGSAATGMSHALFQTAVFNRIAGETNASCCKVCRNSQACGDDCVNWSKICHVGPGCACQQ